MYPDGKSGPAPQPTGYGEARLDIQGARLSVTRISRTAVLVTGIFGSSLALLVLTLGFGNHTTPRNDAPAEENAVRPSGPIESVKDLPLDYGFEANSHFLNTNAQIKPIAPLTTRPVVPSVQELALTQAIRDLSEQRKKAIDQQQKEQQIALDSPLLFGGVKSLVASTGAATGSTTMPTTAERYQNLQHAGDSGNVPIDSDRSDGQTALAAGPSEAHRQREAFLTQSSALEPYSSKALINPISKYELKAGSVIAGAMVTAINTDLPGEVIGQVTENIYDSSSGDYLLIPQGSKLLGTYQSLVANGQNRALLAWQRLIFPNGNSIVLGGMPGTDETGAAGVQDAVDYHLDKLAASTAISTALAYAGNLARNPPGGRGSNVNDVVGDTVAQQANRIGEKIVERELDVQPTITVRPGWPIRVLVGKDLVLQPYVP